MMPLGKVLVSQQVLPHDASVMKVLYLTLARASDNWTMPIRNWSRTIIT